MAAASSELFLANPVARERVQIVAEPMAASYTPAYQAPAAGAYVQYVGRDSQMVPDSNFLTTTCAVAMCAVIGYAVGSSSSQPGPQAVMTRARPQHSRSSAVVMEEFPASYVRGDVTKMPGTYQFKDSTGNKVFDPLNLASKYDVNWLREAELKHGRVTMLATVGFIANDLGLKFPAERFQGISSVDAHDAMVKSGDMWALLGVVGLCELVHMSKIVPRLDGDWAGWEPGNYGIDPWGWASDSTREAELKHSRLAMIAFGGLVTQSALGYTIGGG
jgi:hypothetical protein